MARFTLFFGGICLFLCLTNPSQAQKYSKRKILKDLKELDGFRQSYVGFMLYDPETNKTLACQYDNKYMTPASNTKLYTFFAGLMMLQDRIPAMGYKISGDSLIFWGTGNPLFLHPKFSDETVLSFLKSRPEKLYYYPRPIADDRFGPGWGWDDYNGYYSAEKSVFPIYGNHVQVIANDSSNTSEVTPTFFKNYIQSGKTERQRARLSRQESSNYFKLEFPDHTLSDQDTQYHKDTLRVPFQYSDGLFLELLSDTLKREIQLYDRPVDIYSGNTLAGLELDTLYKYMLQPSDNLLAEQILLMASAQLGDTLSTKTAIEHIKENYFSDWQDPVKWEDGSGLSRYNMFTPRTTIQLLRELRKLTGEERLFQLLPAGGISGTIEDWYAGETAPYVFAKTGTLRNNHCLSGYIKTKKGKTLIFSFMINHYPHSTNLVRQSMETVLEKIRAGY